MILSKCCAARSIASSLDAHFPIYPFGVCNNTVSTSPPERYVFPGCPEYFPNGQHWAPDSSTSVPAKHSRHWSLRSRCRFLVDVSHEFVHWYVRESHSMQAMLSSQTQCAETLPEVQSTHASSPLLGPNVWTGHRMHFLCPCLVDVNPEHAEYRKLFRTRILFHKINGKEKITPCFWCCWVFMMLKYTWILKSQKKL